MFDYSPELSGGSYYPENHQAQLANSFIPMLQHPSQLVAPMPVPMHPASEFEHHPQYSYAGPVLPDQSFDQWEYRTPPAPTPHGLVAPASPREENTVEVVRMMPPGVSQPSPAGVNPQKMAQMLHIAQQQGRSAGLQVSAPAYYPEPVQPAAPATRPAAKKASSARPSAPAQRSYSAGPSHTYNDSSVRTMQAQDAKQGYQRAGGTSRTVTGRVMPAPNEVPVSKEPDTLIQTFADQKTGNIIQRYKDRFGKIYDVIVGNASRKNGAPAPASNAPTKAGQPQKPASKPSAEKSGTGLTLTDQSAVAEYLNWPRASKPSAAKVLQDSPLTPEDKKHFISISRQLAAKGMYEKIFGHPPPPDLFTSSAKAPLTPVTPMGGNTRNYRP